MKRDWDTMRSVLLEVEALSREAASKFDYFAPWHSDDPEAIRAVHALMLEEHGYLGGTRYQTLSEGQYLKGPMLTMTGADLLDSIREQGVWNKMKSIAKEKGVGLAFDSIGGLAKLAIGQMLAPTA